MPRDSKRERQLKLTPVRLPVFELVGRPTGSRGWLVFRCGRPECRALVAFRARDCDKLLKMCPHCFRSGRLPQEDYQCLTR